MSAAIFRIIGCKQGQNVLSLFASPSEMAAKLPGGYEQVAERSPLRGYLYAIRQEIGNANIRFDILISYSLGLLNRPV